MFFNPINQIAKLLLTRAEGMTRQLRHLLGKHEDFRSDPQDPCEAGCDSVHL